MTINATLSFWYSFDYHTSFFLVLLQISCVILGKSCNLYQFPCENVNNVPLHHMLLCSYVDATLSPPPMHPRFKATSSFSTDFTELKEHSHLISSGNEFPSYSSHGQKNPKIPQTTLPMSMRIISWNLPPHRVHLYVQLMSLNFLHSRFRCNKLYPGTCLHMCPGWK